MLRLRSSCSRSCLRLLSTSAPRQLNDVVIVGAARTPIASFQSTLSGLSGPRLASLCIRAALERAKCPVDAVEEVNLGSVLTAGVGQAPDRQAAVFADIPRSVPCTLINKVCASGMKAIMVTAQSLALGQSEVGVAGGFESMSNVPYYLARGATPYGGVHLKDGLVFDGLTDVYNHIHMGNCGENTAKKLSISREEQDNYAMDSYKRAAKAYDQGMVQPELIEVEVPGRRKKDPVTIFKEDEEFRRVNFDRFTELPTVFEKETGTVTAGNASTLSDGATATILMTAKAAERLGCQPLARIMGFADGATDPIDFPLAPKYANDKLLRQVDMNAHQVDLWEINEAFSVVVLANMKLHELDHDKVNIHGGAVSLGHPLGSSGARITNHLMYALKKGQKGVASICNGGGGASAIMLEKL